METVCKLGMKHTVGARQTTPPQRECPDVLCSFRKVEN